MLRGHQNSTQLVSLNFSTSFTRNDYAFRKGYLKDSNLELQCRNPILILCGRNIRAVYPVTCEYTRAMIIMHVPWSKQHILYLSDKSKTIAEFVRQIESKLFPALFIAQYKRALFRHKHSKIEVISKKMIPMDIKQVEKNDESKQQIYYIHKSNESLH